MGIRYFLKKNLETFSSVGFAKAFASIHFEK